MNASGDRGKPTLWRFVLYFLQLGALGFGGPVALANYMRRDLVETRNWVTSEEYENGLALAAACRGLLRLCAFRSCGRIVCRDRLRARAIRHRDICRVALCSFRGRLATSSALLWNRAGGRRTHRQGLPEPRQAHLAQRQGCLDLCHLRLHHHGHPAEGTGVDVRDRWTHRNIRVRKVTCCGGAVRGALEWPRSGHGARADCCERIVLRHDHEAVPLLLQDRAARVRQRSGHCAVPQNATCRSISLAE